MKQIMHALASLVLIAAVALPVMAAERPQRVKTPATSAAASPPPVPAPQPAAPAILSIIPSQSEPGGKVTMFGSGLGAQASAFLGSIELPVRLIEGRQAEFTIPPTAEPGLYALYLRRSDGAVSRPYNFNVLIQRPVLNSISPEVISYCTQGGEREVTARGQNFTEQSQLVFDGAVLRSRFISSEAISFTVPLVAGGLHQVMIRNSPDNASVAMGLIIDTKPEIAQVMIGNRYVNYYELIISGKNFQQNSSIYVDGTRIGGQGGADLAERDKLIYVDCGRLIYQRNPYSQVDKDFRILVMNPGGEASQTVNVTAP